MQMYGIGASSGTNELYHSGAVTMNTNVFMAVRSTVVTALKQFYGRAHALPEGTEPHRGRPIYTTTLLTLVGFAQA